jgi:hypothetical protein
VSGLQHSEAALRLVESHSELFRVVGRVDAYFACEYAAATILHDGRAKYRQARERLELLLSHANSLQLSFQSQVHGLAFVAGTYWAESNYGKSAEYYLRVLDADLGTSGSHQITCERLCDSLIFLRRYEDADRIVLAELRSRHPSGITSKPAIEGHFKTGQREASLRTRICCILPAAFLASPVYSRACCLMVQASVIILFFAASWFS